MALNTAVVNNGNNLVFDFYHKDCRLVLSHTQDNNFAFVACLDASKEEHEAGKNRGVKKYWGRYDPEQPEDSIREDNELGRQMARFNIVL